MTTRTTIVIVAVSLVASALAIGLGSDAPKIHPGPLSIKLFGGFFEVLLGIGLMTAVLAIVPSKQGVAGVRFHRASDFSRLGLEVHVARPLMMRLGMILFGSGQIGVGIIALVH